MERSDPNIPFYKAAQDNPLSNLKAIAESFIQFNMSNDAFERELKKLLDQKFEEINRAPIPEPCGESNARLDSNCKCWGDINWPGFYVQCPQP